VNSLSAWLRIARPAARVGVVLGPVACGTGSTVSPLRGYRILVPGHDALSEALLKSLITRGFTVRRRVQGGGPPTAGLVVFTFKDLSGVPTTRLEARLADTRTGAVVAAVTIVLDSLSPGVDGRARGLADSLAAQLRSRRETPP